MDTTFRPREPFRAKAEIVTVAVAIPTLTANVTNTIHVPTPARRAFVLGVHFSQQTVAADSDGTILATAKRRDVSASADVAMTAAYDLEAATARAAERATMLSGSTRLKAKEDTLFVEVVNNSAAINTQPANGFILVELALLD